MANTQNLDLVKPLGTDHALVSVLNSNSDKIDAYAGAVNAGLDGLRDGLGILADGNTHAAVTSGQFVYVKNHQTLPEGLYKATANIAANGTLSTSNLAADSAGGLNALNEQIANLLTPSVSECGIVDSSHRTVEANRLIKVGKVVHITLKMIAASGYEMTNSSSFTIPSGFRPASQITIPLLYVKGGEITLGTGAITDGGTGWQNYTSSDVQQIFIDTEYVIP